MDESLIIKAAEAMAKLTGDGPAHAGLALIARTMSALEVRSNREPATAEQVREALLHQGVDVSLEVVRKGLWLIRNV